MILRRVAVSRESAAEAVHSIRAALSRVAATTGRGALIISLVVFSVAALFSAATPASSAEPSGAGVAALVKLLATNPSAEIQLDVLRGMSDGLADRRTVPMPPGWDEVAADLEHSTNAEIRELTASLSLTFGSPKALATLRATLADSTAAESARRKALAALIRVRDPQLPPVLRGLLREPALRGSALSAFAAFDAPAAPEAILAIYPSLNEAERGKALGTLCARLSFAKALLAALGDGRIQRKDLTADLVTQLRNLKDPSIDGEIARVWGTARAVEGGKLAMMERYKGMMAQKSGDASRGRLVFERVCAQCHTLAGIGGNLGPDLTAYNRGDVDYLLMNILDPSAIVPNDYRAFTLETKDDLVLTGVVARQDDRSVTLISPGQTNVVPRAEIARLAQGQLSIMPEGLIEGLSDEEVADLLAFIKSPVRPGSPPQPQVTR